MRFSMKAENGHLLMGNRKKFDEHIKQSIPLCDVAHDLVVSLVNLLQEDGQI